MYTRIKIVHVVTLHVCVHLVMENSAMTVVTVVTKITKIA